MKKIILIALIAFSSFQSMSQVSFGGQLGANVGMGHAKDSYYDYYPGVGITNDPKIGFLIGVLAQIDFGKIAFRPELNYVQRGSKTYNDKYTFSYVELPLNVVYNLGIGKVGTVFFGLGPNFGFGLGGKVKYANGSSFKVKFDGKKEAELDANDNYYHFKRTDVGLNIIAGFKLKMGAFARVAFTNGFSNLSPDKSYYDASDDRYYDQSYKNRGVSITVGYMLGGKK